MIVVVWEEITEADIRPVDGYQTSNVFGILAEDLSAPVAVTSPQQCCWERRSLCSKFEAYNRNASSYNVGKYLFLRIGSVPEWPADSESANAIDVSFAPYT